MSVLNQSGEEQVECPLCMEPLEVDDLTFFPCTCGYQICRFCWHRIRTDENGLCPACRKAYSEDPADFIPLSQEQMAKLKAEKRQRDQQRKAKLTESRKHLASVRVVQRNLVFVVGLPMRLADPEVLKRHEYFGKFGKIHKVVINQSTSYAGSQGPSASAYVTYMKSDDALRAIQSVNNITIDGRVIKSSLGTTKYCSHFMKNQTCPKPDCMYLHDFGDPEASFTKEQMHAGKHQEYEKKLHENLLLRTANNNNSENSKPSLPIPTTNSTVKSSSKDNTALSSSVSSSSSTTSNSSGTNKENWPHLNTEKEKKDKEKGKKSKGKGETSVRKGDRKEAFSSGKSDSGFRTEVKQDKPSSPHLSEQTATPSPPTLLEPQISFSKLPASIIDDNTSFFSINSFQKLPHTSNSESDQNSVPEQATETESETHPSSILTDTLPNINTTEDWAAAFGFSRNSENNLEKLEEKDVLDPFRKSFGVINDAAFSKGVESYNNGLYEISPKIQENILEMLSGKTPATFPSYKTSPSQPSVPPAHTHNGINGLDQNMSKFFMDFHKNNKDVGTAGQQHQFNGFNGVHQGIQGYFSGIQNSSDRVMLLQQKHLEEQLLNLSLKQRYGSNSNSVYQNGVNPPIYMNEDNGGFGNVHPPLFNSSSNIKQNNRSTEDELGFDPFQETQKAFADLMATEQNQKSHNSNIGRSQINGVNLNQNGHVPPPPPGFVQTNSSHMNSFGSKILPFLNMSNSQQQINNSTQNNWPSNYNSQPQQQKNISNSCNDWKVLDPAILSSSRHYPLANMPQLRDYTNLSQIGTQQQIQNGSAPPLRTYEYTNNAFSNFTQQLQPNFNNFSHMNSQQNLNWFSNDLNSQISSPPGFRNNPATKQQEC
ncbi:GATA zinc finger domain-containing protein 14 [Diorhabda carinulata]|uniref:GATA zinc finger domain-containing protein 14 n=1 Tax=Diorhabda carinulata TaxID=1163345 RepID=UPI0025A12F1F|nr:GATA zinc finger domain-containing protein 14 [Diorhabda carinulata]XP_057654987.1 GATA zinc finger domain-containing protein 14 [Diorhabda carinulata]XP_057654988.1 GATA zinc finger domain-containing protein 14 [Diorhabda carinulata]XP_057654989.1 GATA zinc finger domain-containing protein 14 [Diorhabda carinulata]XP_057654990.1 GATA zinc finger domain-containing protein 14 [Diorhabda carinulata]